jgi:hypothetical protein
MKLPSLSKDDVIDFLLRHAEKFVVTIVALLAMGLAWGGIDALRTQSVAADKRPDVLSSHARRTLEHIDRDKQPPDDVAPRTPSLTKLVEPWRAPQIVKAPEMALLDRPLFDELGRRTKPEVFPIEDLQATAGVAVFAPRPQAGPGAARPVERDPAPPKGGKTKGKKQSSEEDAAVAGGPGFGGAAPAGDGTPALPAGRIVPYVMVTGLIPVLKQQQDYAQRFQSTSLRDEKRDSPLWSEFLVERSTVVPGGRETWEKIDPKLAARKARDEWGSMQGESLPPGFLLAAEQQPGTGGAVYCAPLPLLVTDGWGRDSMHPWFRQEMDRRRARQEAAQKAAGETVEAGQPVEDAAVQSPLAEQPAGPAPAPARPTDAGTAPDQLAYRMFRFIDTGVQPGKSYRYRVRLSLWNPNYNVPAQHLAEAALAKEAKLASTPSNETTSVTVPGPVNVLVRTLPKADMRRFKPGMAEVLVLGPDDRTGNYALRSVITDLGGFVNVDRKLNKTGDQRTRGEEIFTNAMLLDIAGRQENREDLKTPRNAAPPEPLELLVMRDDGGFDIVTAAAAEKSIVRYAATLPGMANPAETDPGQAPGGQPFSFPGIGTR